MISQLEFRNLIQSIIVEEMKDEKFLFDVEGADIIADLYAGKNVVHTADGAEFKAIDPHSAAQIVQYIPLISGTFTVINSIISLVKLASPTPKPKLTEEVSKRWLETLIAKGIKPAKAKAIVEKFAEDIANIVQKH